MATANGRNGKLHGPNAWREKAVMQIKDAIPPIKSQRDFNEVCIALSIILGALVTSFLPRTDCETARAYDLSLRIMDVLREEVASASR